MLYIAPAWSGTIIAHHPPTRGTEATMIKQDLPGRVLKISLDGMMRVLRVKDKEQRTVFKQFRQDLQPAIFLSKSKNWVCPCA